MAFTYLKVKSAKCLFFYFRWSWCCYFVLGLGLKNLVLFTSLVGDGFKTYEDGRGWGVKISIAVPGHSDSDFRLPND